MTYNCSRIDVAPGEHGVDARVQIGEIVARIRVVDQVAEFAAVAGAAPRIGVEHDVATRRHELFFQIEAIAVIGKRPAVDLEDQWILLLGIKSRRLDDPALDFAVIFRGFVPDLFDLPERSSREQAFVYLGQHLGRRGGLGANGDFPRQIRSRMR